MKGFIKLLITLLAFNFLMASCGSNDLPDSGPKTKKQTLLIYAIASNDLYSNFLMDKEEMLSGASKIDLEKFNVVLYQVTRTEDPILLEISKDATGNTVFSPIQNYDRSLYSTDPARISQVIEDVRNLRPADSYGLVLWSHATGIDPAFSVRNPDTNKMSNSSVTASDSLSFFGGTMAFSFGADLNPTINSSAYDKTDIPELASAIPDGMFDFIWFDACYMANVEAAYELRNKCNSLIAYPTEVYSPGAPYDLILPYLMTDKPQLTEAADVFFKYYSENTHVEYRHATVAVLDMKHMNDLATVCRHLYSESTPPSTTNVQKYSRLKIGPYYDFGQISRLRGESGNNHDLIKDFEEVLSKTVIFKMATTEDFDGQIISPENFSGVSTFNYNQASSTSTNGFYPQLAWWKDVFK